MDPKDFHSTEAGRIVQMPSGYCAFVPAPLPPSLFYSDELVLALSRADAAISELSGVGKTLPDPTLLTAPYVRREAVLSSRIEGTRASLSDIFRDHVDSELEGIDRGDVDEVLNYVAALEYGIARLETLPLSLRLVREVHARLMQGLSGAHITPGEFRRSQNWIGPSGSTPVTAPFVPPPVEHLNEALGEWEKFLHVREMPELIQCGLLHEQFEAIHPFLDGNGRVGRLLIVLFLIERGRLSHPLLYPSDYIEKNRSLYYESLQRVRTHGDWHGWLMFFLTALFVTARQGIAQASELASLRETLQQELGLQPRAMALVDELFKNPYTSVSRAAKGLSVSLPTAAKTIEILVRADVLTEVSGRQWKKVYEAKPILNILSGLME